MDKKLKAFVESLNDGIVYFNYLKKRTLEDKKREDLIHRGKLEAYAEILDRMVELGIITEEEAKMV